MSQAIDKGDDGRAAHHAAAVRAFCVVGQPVGVEDSVIISGFRCVRAQNRKPVVKTPIATVMGLTAPSPS